MNNYLKEISQEEWQEILEMPLIRNIWSLEEGVSSKEFSVMVYGVKFDYQTDFPDYSGDLYIIQDGTLGTPLQIVRKNGALKLLGQLYRK